MINDPDRVRRRLGFMPDYFGTYSNVDCREYLDFFARAYGVVGKDRLRAIKHVMSFTRLDTLAEKPIGGLSKGMKQRLCLARAMVHDPGVLILDEPAAGLDPRARIELREMIRQLSVDGKTVLVSSHILTELAEMCDTVGIIEQGRLLAVGTVDEIQKGQKKQSVVRVQVLGGGTGLAEWLGKHPELEDIHVDGERVAFSHEAGLESEAQLLKEMVQAGFRVAQFGSQPKSLEDVFMQVTEGVVQ